MQIQQDFCRKLCDQNLLVDKYGMSPLSHILMNLILKFVLFFSSSLAVFGGDLPEIIQDSTAVTPQSTYGAQKSNE